MRARGGATMSRNELYNACMRASAASDLTKHEKQVYQQIAFHRNHKTGLCNPGSRTLARETGLCRPTVLKAIDGLKAKGYLIFDEKERYQTKYYFPESGQRGLPDVEQQPSGQSGSSGQKSGQNQSGHLVKNEGHLVKIDAPSGQPALPKPVLTGGLNQEKKTENHPPPPHEG